MTIFPRHPPGRTICLVSCDREAAVADVAHEAVAGPTGLRGDDRSRGTTEFASHFAKVRDRYGRERG